MKHKRRSFSKARNRYTQRWKHILVILCVLTVAFIFDGIKVIEVCVGEQIVASFKRDTFEGVLSDSVSFDISPS